jgi:hypothetical protein
MNNTHTFVLTNKQADKLRTTVGLFMEGAVERNTFHGPFLLLLGGVQRAIIEQYPLEQHHMDVILWIMDLIFAQMDEDEFDPLLEQVYQKIAGWWPVEPPWYERV